MHSEQLLFFCSSLVSSLINGNKTIEIQPKNILIIKLDEIGDMIYCLHVLKSLRTRYANTQIDLYCKGMNNNLVDNIGLDRIFNEPKEVFRSRYDVVIDLRGNWKTMFWSIFRSKMRFDRGSIRLKNKLYHGQKHEKITNWEIAEPLLQSTIYIEPSIIIDDADRVEITSKLKEIGLGKYVLMHTGARDLSRRWPSERFIEIANKIHVDYGLPTVLCGAPSERQEMEHLKGNEPFIFNMAGETTLRELAVLCERAELFVGNESGPMHFANISGTPLIALFGPGVKDVFYPYGEKSRVIHHVDVDIAGRMEKITVEEVSRAIEELLTTQ